MFRGREQVETESANLPGPVKPAYALNCAINHSSARRTTHRAISTTSDRVTDSTPEAQIRQLRTPLAEVPDEESRKTFDTAREQWDTGELQRVIDDGDFSDLPDGVRPRE